MQNLSQRMRILAVAALCMVWLGLGCGSDPEESGECTTGASQVCTCDDGQSGTQLCEAETWQACVCSNTSANAGTNAGTNNGASDAGADASEDSGLSDASEEQDASVEPDATTDGGRRDGGRRDGGGPPACETDEDCAEGCVPDRTAPCVCNETGNFGLACVPSCETDEDCPELSGGAQLECNEEEGVCVPPM